MTRVPVMTRAASAGGPSRTVAKASNRLDRNGMRSMGPLDGFSAGDDGGVLGPGGNSAAPDARRPSDIGRRSRSGHGGFMEEPSLAGTNGRRPRSRAAAGRKPYPKGKSPFHGRAPRELVGSVYLVGRSGCLLLGERGGTEAVRCGRGFPGLHPGYRGGRVPCGGDFNRQAGRRPAPQG
ncbi:hypothetical protein D3C85_1103080 [compost metagenome]